MSFKVGEKGTVHHVDALPPLLCLSTLAGALPPPAVHPLHELSAAGDRGPPHPAPVERDVAALAAMLTLMREASHDGWTADMVARGVDIQRRVIGYRKRILDRSDDLEAAIGELMREARALHLPTSAETVHTSAVDGEGTGCSITMSAGYGAGVLPPGTGCWLNNSLGEVELNPEGLKIVEPGGEVVRARHRRPGKGREIEKQKIAVTRHRQRAAAGFERHAFRARIQAVEEGQQLVEISDGIRGEILIKD